LTEFLAIFAELPMPVKTAGRPKKRFVPSFELVEEKATTPRQPLAASVPPRAPSAAEEAGGGSSGSVGAADTGAAAPVAPAGTEAASASAPSEGNWREAVSRLESSGPVYTAADPGTFNAAKHVPVVSFRIEEGASCR